MAQARYFQNNVRHCPTFHLLIMKNKTLREVKISLRLEKELAEALQKLAGADQRSLSDFIRVHLKKLTETAKQEG